MHRDIKYNQKAWLKLQIDMSTELRKKAKKKKKRKSRKILFLVFVKTLENVRKTEKSSM